MQFSDKMIKRVASKHFPGGPGLVFKQAIAENWTRLRTQMSFRSNENSEAVRAYSAMSIEEFHGINARQAWSNWRTVPRNLSGNIPNRPLFAVDLCCGTGQSSSVLAWYLPEGSRILGLEYNPAFVNLASERKYLDSRGTEVPSDFCAQSVLEQWRDTQGNVLPAGSVDIANCCGAVGHHFDASATVRLADECARSLRVGGVALIDSGPHGTSTNDLIAIFESRGFEAVSQARSCIVDRYIQVCFKKIR